MNPFSSSPPPPSPSDPPADAPSTTAASPPPAPLTDTGGSSSCPAGNSLGGTHAPFPPTPPPPPVKGRFSSPPPTSNAGGLAPVSGRSLESTMGASPTPCEAAAAAAAEANAASCESNSVTAAAGSSAETSVGPRLLAVSTQPSSLPRYDTRTHRSAVLGLTRARRKTGKQAGRQTGGRGVGTRDRRVHDLEEIQQIRTSTSTGVRPFFIFYVRAL